MITLMKRRRKDPNTGKFVYYPRWKKTSKITKTDMADMMARHSTFSVGEVEGQITDFAQYIIDQILAGNEVDLQGFGKFTPHVNGPSHESASKLTTEGLQLSVNFKLDKSLQSRLDAKKKFKFLK